MNAAQHDWAVHNQRQLATALDEIRLLLERHTARGGEAPTVRKPLLQPLARTGVHEREAPPTALDQLCGRLGLSAFERKILLLTAGMELDGRFPALCAAARGGEEGPSFALALAIFAEAAWSALAPTAPLCYWRLIEVGKGATLVHSPLRIDAYVLIFPPAHPHADPRLLALAEPRPAAATLAPSQQRLAE